MLLTNSNGEYGDGSSNKTPDIVVPIRRPPLVAHILQPSRTSWVGEEGRENGESIATVRLSPAGIQGPEVCLPNASVETRLAASQATGSGLGSSESEILSRG